MRHLSFCPRPTGLDWAEVSLVNTPVMDVAVVTDPHHGLKDQTGVTLFSAHQPTHLAADFTLSARLSPTWTSPVHLISCSAGDLPAGSAVIPDLPAGSALNPEFQSQQVSPQQDLKMKS